MENKNVKKNKVINIILKIIQVVLIGVFLFSGYKIITWHFQNLATQQNLDDVNKHVTESVEEIVDENGNTFKKQYINVDFNAIKELNSDTVGYVKVNNLNIEYPVVQSINNDYYLYRSFDKSYNEAGWIFADYRNKIDESDKNIILYGHNRRDSSMFGDIDIAFTEEWYTNEDNMIITFVTENGYYEYEIFSMYNIEKEDYYITTDFNDVSYDVFLDTILNRSMYDFGVGVDTDTQILTLSTCTTTTFYRLVIHAKLVNKFIKY